MNGKPCELPGAPTRSLLAFLRSGVGLTGVKPGCGEGECGACTVLVDGIPVLACQATVGDVAGRSVTTIEGLASNGRLHPVQQAFAEARLAVRILHACHGATGRGAAGLSRGPTALHGLRKDRSEWAK